ncbi:copper homeostasis periplasmic binding protein CopC [Pseudomonas sp. NFX224]|uniref:copper homeostasis periplasmic binding protein CopC n=1 Tax=Pseudomonas sp. NFX224 TaxID=3402862 RepID=UPI003AFB13DF
MRMKKTLTAAALLGSLLAASSVFAHAHLQSQTPAADSTVKAPAELSLVFSEGVEADFCKVTITHDGADVLVKSLATQGPDKKTLVVTPAVPLTAGDYKVEWHVVSVDTHKSEGAYAFEVDQ